MQAIKWPNFATIFSKKDQKLGTIAGVYLPNILQMIGVILFLRLGWVLSHVGIYKMVTVITLSSSILLITGLSMTSIVTNMKVGSGGSYYIISRSLGIQFGSCMGLLLCLSQLTSIALCTCGFSESLHALIPFIPIAIIKIVTLTSLVIITLLSAEAASKTQAVIFVCISLALVSVYSGNYENIQILDTPLKTLPFWVAFAMFFPATTGIEVGMSLSGDIKNPSKSLPIGTLLSILTAFVLYSSLALFLHKHIPYSLLQNDHFILCKLAKYKSLVILGIWGATLSSALGSMLSAPRTMQALAKDGVLPSKLKQGYGSNNLPRIATVLTFIMASVLTLTTNINQIIPLLTMICLVFYGLINFVSFFESLIQNPSWRPTFTTPWYISLIGCVSCLIAMLLINVQVSLIFFVFMLCINLILGARNLSNNWDDIRYSIFGFVVKFASEKLNLLQVNAKSWRPHLLTITDYKYQNEALMHFASNLSQKRSLFTYAVISENMQDPMDLKPIYTKLKSNHISCFVHGSKNSIYHKEVDGLIRNYGLGPIVPNTIVVPYDEQLVQSDSFGDILINAYNNDKNFILFKAPEQCLSIFTKPTKKVPKHIDLWWGGFYRKNLDLSLALLQLITKSPAWKYSKITIKSLVKDSEQKIQILKRASEYHDLVRLKNLSFEPFVEDFNDFYKSFPKYSMNAAHLTFVGLRPPKKDEAAHDYTMYAYNVFIKTKDLPSCVYILAGEKLNFLRIFKHKQ